MRVIAGKWRGRRLRAPRGDEVRPTTDRVKEALFSILGGDVAGTLCLDLCCGSGSLGIEALSRGADSAVFVDRSGASLQLARRNLEDCGADPAVWSLIRANAGEWFERWRPPESKTPWILLADPPYRSGLVETIMARIRVLAGSPGFRAAILEHGTGTDLGGGDADRSAGDGCGDDLRLDTRRYGESCLTVIRGRSTPAGG